jgi:hypothetical protein
MVQWYNNAGACYVLLSDLPPGTLPEDGFAACKWFTRGWALQELIAPKEVFFYDKTWNWLGTRTRFSSLISSVTNVNEKVLLRSIPHWDYSVTTRMSRAAHRKTTRVEDIAYCPLGIFRVNTPMIYGEGLNAFLRLQQDIVKCSNDLTIFAWDQEQNEMLNTHLFAPSPAKFARSNGFCQVDRLWLDPVFALTNKVLKFDNFKQLWKRSIKDADTGLETMYWISLGFRSGSESDDNPWIAIPLRKVRPNLFVRVGTLRKIPRHLHPWNNTSSAAVTFYLQVSPIPLLTIENGMRQETVSFPQHNFQWMMPSPKAIGTLQRRYSSPQGMISISFWPFGAN